MHIGKYLHQISHNYILKMSNWLLREFYRVEILCFWEGNSEKDCSKAPFIFFLFRAFTMHRVFLGLIPRQLPYNLYKTPTMHWTWVCLIWTFIWNHSSYIKQRRLCMKLSFLPLQCFEAENQSNKDIYIYIYMSLFSYINILAKTFYIGCVVVVWSSSFSFNPQWL